MAELDVILYRSGRSHLLGGYGFGPVRTSLFGEASIRHWHPLLEPYLHLDGRNQPGRCYTPLGTDHAALVWFDPAPAPGAGWAGRTAVVLHGPDHTLTWELALTLPSEIFADLARPSGAGRLARVPLQPHLAGQAAVVRRTVATWATEPQRAAWAAHLVAAHWADPSAALTLRGVDEPRAVVWSAGTVLRALANRLDGVDTRFGWWFAAEQARRRALRLWPAGARPDEAGAATREIDPGATPYGLGAARHLVDHCHTHGAESLRDLLDQYGVLALDQHDARIGRVLELWDTTVDAVIDSAPTGPIPVIPADPRGPAVADEVSSSPERPDTWEAADPVDPVGQDAAGGSDGDRTEWFGAATRGENAGAETTRLEYRRADPATDPETRTTGPASQRPPEPAGTGRSAEAPGDRRTHPPPPADETTPMERPRATSALHPLAATTEEVPVSVAQPRDAGPSEPTPDVPTPDETAPDEPGVLCPVCLSHVTLDHDALYQRHNDGYLPLTVPPDATPAQRDQQLRWAQVRCPNQGVGVGEQHYLPYRYVAHDPVVISFVGSSRSGKTHLLAAMIGAIERGDLAPFGISAEPLDPFQHEEFLATKAWPLLDEGRKLTRTPPPEGDHSQAEAMLLVNGPRPRAVALFDIAGEELARYTRAQRQNFLRTVHGLVFLVDPDLMRAGATRGDPAFSAILSQLPDRPGTGRKDAAAALVLAKADQLRYTHPVDRWLREPTTGLDADALLAESEDVYALLHADPRTRPWLQPYRACDRATLHVASATDGPTDADTDQGRFVRPVRPRRVLEPLVALLAMTGVLATDEARKVGR